MTIRSLLVATAAFAALTAFSAQARDVHMKMNPIVSGPTVTLGDLFDNTGAEAASVVVGDAPAPGEKMLLRSEYVASLVKNAGLTWAGDQAVRNLSVARAGRLIPRGEVTKVLAVQANRNAGGGRFDVELDNRNVAYYVADQNEPTVRVEDLDLDRRTGRFTAVLAYPADARNPERAKVSGRAIEYVEVPVLRDYVKQGQIIGWNDIEYLEMRPDQLQRISIVNAQEIVGLSARRSLQPGQALRQTDLKKAELVNRNAGVSIVLRSAGLLLAAPGRAIEAGSMGDVIQVMNLQSNKTVYARIVNQNEVTPIGQVPPPANATVVN